MKRVQRCSNSQSVKQKFSHSRENAGKITFDRGKITGHYYDADLQNSLGVSSSIIDPTERVSWKDERAPRPQTQTEQRPRRRLFLELLAD